MRLGSTTTYRRPKYCQSSGLFRANRLRVKQRPFRRPEGSWQPFFGISRVSSSSTAGGREDHGAVLQGFIDAIRYSIEGEPSLMAAEKVFLHHDNASAHSSCISESVSLWISLSFSIFTESSPQRLFPVPNPKKIAGKEEIFIGGLFADLEALYFPTVWGDWSIVWRNILIFEETPSKIKNKTTAIPCFSCRVWKHFMSPSYMRKLY